MKFKNKIRDIGNSYVVTIPSAYVNNGLIKMGVLYQFEFEEITGVKNGKN